MRPRGSSLLALSFMFMFAACPADPGPDSASGGSSGGEGSTGGEPTTGGSTGPAEDLNPHELGAQASAACVDAMPAVKDFMTATAAGDAAGAMTAYGALQGFVQALDAANEQMHDAAIAAALAQGDAAGAALAEGHLLSSLARHMRNNLTAVETGAPEQRYAAWDEGYCVWNGGLKDLATRAQSAAWVAPGDPIVADIDAAFAAGHDAIGGDGAATAIDEWRVPPARQIIEKTLFRAAQRDIVHLAVGAKMAGDPVSAARALGEFGIVRDRLTDRNTPGIALIEGMLAGDPAMISGELIAIELDKAFAKRTYAYAGMPADGLGVPTSYKSAVEGRTYAKLIVAGIAAAMMPTEDYLADWDEFVELVRTGSDMAAAEAVSQRLLDVTCNYQKALGIATCTSSDDEVAP
jgi:hypothetical protein